MFFLKFIKWTFPVAIMLLLRPLGVIAQTDEDAIMMPKDNFCLGGVYSYNSWTNYWEGTFKRNNPNLGTVSTKIFGLMGTYGITKKWNVVINAPYVETHASAGVLHGLKGIQDLSVWLKWLALEKDLGNGTLSLYAVGGASIPLTNYIADYMPLSIGLQSKTLSGRIIADYQHGNFFATGSGTYTWRSNITVDEPSYYTTDLHNTNQVQMPDLWSFNFRTGYRSERLVAEATISNMTTIGGFDIRKNAMPFPSVKMDATMIGADFKYTFKAVSGLSLVGGVNTTISGSHIAARNVGEASGFDIGVFYVLDLSHKTRHSGSQSTKTK
jgi:hypothetical protein